MKFSLEENRSYWDDPNTISLIDSNLRDLEIAFVSRFLNAEQVIADIGCGDGTSTFEYAEKVKQCFGIERSDFLRSKALKSLRGSRASNLEFIQGDILDLSGFHDQFDLVVTERVIINLPSWELQMQAIDNVYHSLRPSGMYIMVENTHDGNEILNKYRQLVGLDPIPIHWHNVLLDYEKLRDHIQGKYRIIERHSFGLYYLLTRVYVQMFASYTGSGASAKADTVFTHSDRAARQLFEAIGNQIEFKDNEIFGPIQGIALQKI